MKVLNCTKYMARECSEQTNNPLKGMPEQEAE